VTMSLAAYGSLGKFCRSRALKKFEENFQSFLTQQGRSVDVHYLLTLLNTLSEQAERPSRKRKRLSESERQRRHRIKEKLGLQTSETGGNRPSNPVLIEGSIIYWMRHGDGLKFDKRRRFMSVQKAAIRLAQWQLLLGLVEVDAAMDDFFSEDEKFEEKVRIVSNRLIENYKLWDSRQLPTFPRGWTLYSNSRRPVKFSKK
jgi:hypothetical protein